MFFESKRYSYKIREQLRAPKKIYCVDHGLVQAVRFAFSENHGRMLENMVYIELKRRKAAIYYHQDDKECDFLAVYNNKLTEAIQVTAGLSDSKTKKREVEGLKEALSRYGLKEGLILTEDEVDILKIGKIKIKILPLWYWLLLSTSSTI